MEKLNKENKLILVGSRPGLGKTTYAVNVSKDLVKMGKKVAYLDYDCPCRVKDKINDENFVLYGDDDLPLGIDNLVEISKYEKDLDLLVVDYLQLVENDSAHNAVTNSSNVLIKLKELKETTNISIMVLSELSRNHIDNVSELETFNYGSFNETNFDEIIFIYEDNGIKKIRTYDKERQVSEKML